MRPSWSVVLASLMLCASLPAVALSQAKPPEATYGQGVPGGKTLKLATGSPGELGLVKALAEEFAKAKGVTVQWFKAGSGESLDMLKNKAVDLIMVHAPAAEKKAVQEGWAANRTLIGSNEFFIVGPSADAAGVTSANSAAEAYRKIAAKGAKFFSRGDNSGTHQKELQVWKSAEITPAGEWYIVTRDFMGPTLKRADAEGGYFMADSSTWAAERKKVPNLVILFPGENRSDKFLVNTYHAMSVPAGATESAGLAAEFIAFISSEAGQAVIRTFGKEQYGEAIYNDAAYAAKFVY